MIPLARFLCSFPSQEEIKGYENYFVAHPDNDMDDCFGITSLGLKLFSGIIVSMIE